MRDENSQMVMTSQEAHMFIDELETTALKTPRRRKKRTNK